MSSEDNPADEYENYPCDTCNGEVVYFEGTWICNSCEKIFQGGEPV